MKYIPHAYQEHATKWILEHPHCGLFLDMGLGKTVITLSAVKQLIDNLDVFKVLVVAPLRVASTVWAEEIDKWDHLRGLRAVKVLGSQQQRMLALCREADIYIVNRENVDWLVNYKGKRWDFDMVVLDELSSFKSPSSARFKAMRRALPYIRRLVGLTGTPAPNGLIDLWSQIYLLDKGERLGRTLGSFRTAFFTPGKHNGNVVYEWRLRPDTEDVIYRRISDLCISMRSVDYLTMPECNLIRMPISLPKTALSALAAMEHDLMVTLDGEAVTAQSAAVLTGKLLQMANGAVYDPEGGIHEIHDAKLDALDDLVEQANGSPVLVYYSYKHDLQRILGRFPDARVLSTPQDVADWNEGKIQLMLAHPDSAGHGLNLQRGGHIMVWFGLTWSLEKYQQANARLYRQGQTHPVTIYHLIAEGTMDERVMQILEGKEQRQDDLIEAVKAQLKL